MDKDLWSYLKKLAVTPRPAMRLIVGHPGSVLGDLPHFVRLPKAHGTRGAGTTLTQHQRVVLGRKA